MARSCNSNDTLSSVECAPFTAEVRGAWTCSPRASVASHLLDQRPIPTMPGSFGDSQTALEAILWLVVYHLLRASNLSCIKVFIGLQKSLTN